MNDPKTLQDVVEQADRRGLSPGGRTIADLMNDPRFQEYRRAAREHRRAEIYSVDEPGYQPPTKPLNRWSEAELEEAVANCTTCHGVGAVKPNTDDLFPRATRCPSCAPYQAELRQRRDIERMRPLVEQYTMLRGALLGKTFRTFEGYTPNVKAAWTAVYDWTKALYQRNVERPWLFLYGPPGTGKTHLAAATANAMSQTGTPVIFTTFPELLGMVSADGFARKEQAIQALQGIAVLVIDDLRKEDLGTDWATSILFRVLDHRYVTRSATMVVSNHPAHSSDPAIVSLDRFESRVSSRLSDRQMAAQVALVGDDYRSR